MDPGKKQEKVLLTVTVIVAVIMLLALAGRLFS